MTLAVVRSPEAEQDLAEIAGFLAQKGPRVAMRFLDAVADAFVTLAAMPEIGSIYETSNPQLSQLRVWPVNKFTNYLIYYHATAEAIEIVRVVHGARDIDSLLSL